MREKNGEAAKEIYYVIKESGEKEPFSEKN